MYSYKPTETFWKQFYALPNGQKSEVRWAWKLFKKDPFDPKLGVHRIASYSGKKKTTVHAVRLSGRLRVLFRIRGSVVETLNVGEELYKH